MTTTTNNTVKGIEVDHINGAIVVTKNFLKLAKNPSTSEFERLIYTRKECPTYGIVVRTIDKNENKESYEGLSIEKMLAYIHVFEKENLADFENTIKVYSTANGKIQKGKYATIKKVFLSRFKENYIRTIENIDNVVRIDEKAKELKEKSKGLVLLMLNEKAEDNKVAEFPMPQKKAVNE